jgi:signal transduction histidine kinase
LFHGATIGLLLGWLGISIWILFPFAPNPGVWHREANALARYAICFPGGLLAAYGLRRHALQRLAPLNAPHIVATLRVAGIALGLYALFAGLVPPPIPFFPGDRLNTQTFQVTLGAPVMVFRSLIGLLMTIAIIRGLEIFELETERFVEAIEQKQILATERERLARELHDGVIQKVYTAGLPVQSAENQMAAENPVKARLAKAALVLNDAIADLRRNLGELRAARSELALPDALRQLTQDSRFQSLIEISLQLDLPKDESFSLHRTDDVLAVVNEALSNVVRHARATHVTIAARRESGRLRLTVADDGAGLPKNLVEGYGLRNMRDRARLLGGAIQFHNSETRGLTAILDVPWRDER